MTVEAVLLGVAQDGGLPQPGCQCAHCVAARRDPARRQRVVSLGLVDYAAAKSWLIDATPDFPAQYDTLTALAPLDGILLTHAHIGHYPGLIYLGPEAMNTHGLPVYATQRMAAFLQANAPWSLLVAAGHIRLIVVAPEQAIRLSPRLWATPIPVPHRDELSDTVAWLLRGPRRSLFYCPDIDHWDAFQPDFRTWLAGVDIALLDGSFFAPTELSGRDLSAIPHPLATETARRLRHSDTDTTLIHLNHSNPLWHEGPERAWLRAQGLRVGRQGDRWLLD